MLSDDELNAMAMDLETDRVERKASFANSMRDRVAQAICAFANDMPGNAVPGYVLIGVNDDGSPAKLPITDELLLNLAAIRDDGKILPLPSMSVQKRTIAGSDVAVIEVMPSGDPPVRYDGRTWIRVGPRRAIASRDEERRLTEKRRAADLPDDGRGIAEATISDLDLDYFRNTYLRSAVAADVLEENGRTIEQQLSSLHLLRNKVPTKASLLLIGSAPRSWVPGAYLQFVRVQGTRLTDPILDQKEIDGRLGEILMRVDDLLKVNIRISTSVEGDVLEQRRPDYPMAALQQLVRNAFMHRSYESNAPVHLYWFEDRIEIHSPGGLSGMVTPETFGGVGITDYRNPSIAEGMKVLGFVQRFGMGLELARQRCAENGNSAPEFKFSSAVVLCTIRGYQ